MENALFNVVVVTLVLGFMILIHEWGHFVAARLLGVRVNVFSIGFGPRIFGFRRGDTDYRISILPFGGYVKMAGDNPLEEHTGSPDEFLSKSRWQRVLIALAGPFMNILLAIVITAGIFMTGAPEAPFLNQPVRVAGVVPGSPAAQGGLRSGDVIVKVNGHRTPNWDEALFESGVAPAGSRLLLTVERNGGQEFLQLPPAPPANSRDAADLIGYPQQATLIDSVEPGHPASRAGMETGDRVISADGHAILNPVEFTNLVKDSNGRVLDTVVERGGKELHLQLEPTFRDPGDGVKRWSIGVTIGTDTVIRSHPFFQSTGMAFSSNYRMTEQIIQVLGGLFAGKISLKQLGGPVGIAPQLGAAARRGFGDLLDLTAVISLNLGILNLLPIPILDGGHIMMLAVEGVIRRDLSITVKERFVQVGLVFLLGLIVLVTYNDIMKLLPWH